MANTFPSKPRQIPARISTTTRVPFSIVLLALVDANYRFVVIDVGAYGRSSDGGIFSTSALGMSLVKGELNIPEDNPLPGEHDKAMPHVIVGDEAFPLKKTIRCGHTLQISLAFVRKNAFSSTAFHVPGVLLKMPLAFKYRDGGFSRGK